MKSGIGSTGIGDRTSGSKTFLLKGLPEKVSEIQSRNLNVEESNDLRGGGMKIIIASNIIDIRTY